MLQLNDESDYMSILGARKIYPSKIYGRGLVKLDDVYEFQTAHVYEPEKLSEHIVSVCESLKEKAESYAEPVKILPEVVTTDYTNSKLRGLHSVPIGVNKNTLEISTWDFKNNMATVISALEFENMNYFIRPFIDEFKEIKNSTVLVLDAVDLLKDTVNTSNTFYYKNDFSKVITSLNNTILKQKEIFEKNNYNKMIFENVKPVVCIVVGVDNLLMKLDANAKNSYTQLIDTANIVQTIKFIFIDTIDIFKKIEYDNWYKAIVKNNQGIWIGNGISEQYTIKLSKITRELQEDIDDGFGYVIKRGVPVLTKMITSENGYKGDEYE